MINFRDFNHDFTIEKLKQTLAVFPNLVTMNFHFWTPVSFVNPIFYISTFY